MPLIDFNDPNDMALWGALGNVLTVGSTPHPGMSGMGAGNAFLALAGAGLQGATTGAQAAQKYQAGDIANQTAGLGLERQKAIQPYQIKMIKDMMGGGAPGSLMGSAGSTGSPADAMFKQAYMLALSGSDPSKAGAVLQAWAEHSPQLAGAIEKEKQRVSVHEGPNGPYVGYPGGGDISEQPPAFGSMAPPPGGSMPSAQLAPPPASAMLPPVPSAPPVVPPSIMNGVSNAPAGQALGRMVDANGKQAELPTAFDATGGIKADPTGKPAYKIDPFKKTDVEFANKAMETDMKVSDEYSSQLNLYAQAEQRLNTVADAFKKIQSGGLTTQKAEIANTLQGLGIDPSKYNLDDPTSVYNVLHEQGINTLQQLKTMTAGAGSRITNSEFVRIGDYMNNPNLPPATNLQLLGEAIGAVHYNKGMIEDWNKSGGLGNRLADGYTMRPNDFERKWQLDHKMGDFVDAVKKDIGPLKGMEGNNAPTQAVRIYHRVNGKLVAQ